MTIGDATRNNTLCLQFLYPYMRTKPYLPGTPDVESYEPLLQRQTALLAFVIAFTLLVSTGLALDVYFGY